MGILHDIRTLGLVDLETRLTTQKPRLRAAVVCAPEPMMLIRRGDSTKRALACASSAFAGS